MSQNLRPAARYADVLRNPILNCDSYKASHFAQYPPDTTHVSSYVEARGGDFEKMVFFGLQIFLKEYLSQPISQTDIDQAEAILTAHGEPFNKADWQYILEKYAGFLPIRIEAVPEGMVLPLKNAVVQVVNTDPKLPWLTSYVETALLRAIWYPCTVATLSWHARQIIQASLARTADNTDGLPFKLHDFGARGVSSLESAAIGGLAHLVNFQGTDTLAAILAGREFYDCDMAGFSIPAAEHSTITSWTHAGETAAYANMLTQFGGAGKLVAVVSDSYDLWNAIENLWGDELKTHIETMGGTLVIRPDSGEPTEIVPAALEKLIAKFGFSLNTKNFKVLPNCVRLIQGDGVSLRSIQAILEAVEARGISTDNLAFGMGGELLQKVNRDSLRWAMKASAAQVAGEWRDVYKDPITDSGKRSKRGRLAVAMNANGVVETCRIEDLGGRANLLRPVWENGKLLIDDNFALIRARAAG